MTYTITGATLPRPHDALEAQDLRGYMSSIGLSNSWIDAKQNKLPWSQVVSKLTSRNSCCYFSFTYHRTLFILTKLPNRKV